MSAALEYIGPQCPRCGMPLPDQSIRSGVIECNYCKGEFEATAFELPQRQQTVIQTVEAFPEGANMCANHARNAAVTSCQRCGLFICSLCEMKIAGQTLCPDCFEVQRNEGSLKEVTNRYRDYASIARVTTIAGIFFWWLGPLVPGFAAYYAWRGIKQRREEGRSTTGMVITMILAIIELLAFSGFLIAMFAGLMGNT